MFSGVPGWGVLLMTGILILAVWFIGFSGADFKDSSTDRVLGIFLYFLGVWTGGILVVLVLALLFRKLGWIE